MLTELQEQEFKSEQIIIRDSIDKIDQNILILISTIKEKVFATTNITKRSNGLTDEEVELFDTESQKIFVFIIEVSKVRDVDINTQELFLCHIFNRLVEVSKM